LRISELFAAPNPRVKQTLSALTLARRLAALPPRNCVGKVALPMKIQFLGAVDTVTGSHHIVEANGERVLRDFGLFQGRRDESRERNRRFTFDPGTISSVVLSHAHIDHCGNLPSLARCGYAGAIHTTTATVDLCAVMLRDAAHIQQQDAAYLNQKTNRKGLRTIEPLYTLADAEQSLTLMQGHMYGESVEAAAGIRVTYHDAGHILGAALTVFEIEEDGRRQRVAFAFDLGRKHLPLIRDPEIVRDIDVLIMESTYGDRLHDNVEHAEEQLREVVARTLARHGKVLIPSFALERAQEIIYHLASLVNSGRLPEIPVYVDSPMASAVSQVFEKHTEYLDEEYRRLQSRIGNVMHPRWLKYVDSVEESKRITASDASCIVIAASGMCEHGRILHHLKHGIEKPYNTIVIVGFQAGHTLGRKLLEGETKVRIFGDWFERKAEVVVLNAFSAHADRNNLAEYAQMVAPRKIFLVHGEPRQREALAAALKDQGHKEVYLPAPGDVAQL
jgi:metallo-beta-lactamase family protein